MRIKEIIEALEKLQNECNFADINYDKALTEAQIWLKRLEKENMNESLCNAISEKGVTREKICSDIGISLAALNSYQKRRNVPSVKVAIKIADYLGHSIDELFGDL